jgi:two-component system, OmpR family, phosphate regulon sensor histidine kinase PhoR
MLKHARPKIVLLNMKNRHLRPIIIWGTFILVCLIVVQFYWFSKAFSAEERQFDHTVQMVLKKVADSVSQTNTIKKFSSNFFYVNTQIDLNSSELNSLLEGEFELHDLNISYELGIYRADDDTLVYGNYIPAARKKLHTENLIPSRVQSTEENFAVYFPRKKSYVAAQLQIWFFSTGMLLLMAGFFAYAIASLLRERKFAELKSDFLNNMTHEFKTPVTNIKIASEILKQKFGDSPGTNAYLDILIKENEKLRLKIEHVLLGSTVEHKKQPALAFIDLHELIRDCAEAFNFKLREREGHLTLELNSRSQHIFGDREMLAQALNNVIDNAEKYSPHQPQIFVRTNDNGKDIEVIISDNGIGIANEMRSKVFEKFFRVPTGNVHTVKGFGLGLSFVKSAIEKHRGRIKLFSRLNEGTEVRIILPKA